MAGDWIKMRIDIADDPAVIGMASALDITEDEVVGKLHRIWSWADKHTASGFVPRITGKWIDRYINLQGFSEQMQAVGWIVIADDGVTFPSFDRHNGKSAKSRAENTERARNSRKSRDEIVTSVDCLSQKKCDENVTREEKRREELTTSSLRSDVVSALTADDEPQRKTSGTPKRATQLPDDFEPDDTAAALAAELCVSLTAELPKFRDYHAARGKPMKNWQAALRTWLRNAKQFAKPVAKQTESERRAAWLADITGRKGDAIDAPARIVG